MNFIGVFNHENVVGESFLNGFSNLVNTKACAIPDENWEELIRKNLKENNVFIFNSKFINELEVLDIYYADTVCLQLNSIFKTLKRLISILLQEDKKGKFLFITTNPSITHASSFPISPIHDEALHSLIRSLAKEFKSGQMVFHGICIEPIFEMLEEGELRNYQKKMKEYAMQKRPIKLEVLTTFIKNISLTNLDIASGNIFYIAEGLDQVNF